MRFKAWAILDKNGNFVKIFKQIPIYRTRDDAKQEHMAVAAAGDIIVKVLVTVECGPKS